MARDEKFQQYLRDQIIADRIAHGLSRDAESVRWIQQNLDMVALAQQYGIGGPGADAGTTPKGIAKLSVAPVSSVNPIAAGDNDPRLSDARTPTGAAGGVLSGTYPNPGFATTPFDWTAPIFSDSYATDQLTAQYSGDTSKFTVSSGTVHCNDGSTQFIIAKK